MMNKLKTFLSIEVEHFVIGMISILLMGLVLLFGSAALNNSEEFINAVITLSIIFAGAYAIGIISKWWIK